MAFPILTEATWVNDATGAPLRYTAQRLRAADSALYVRGGIVRASDLSLAVTVDGSDNVTIQPGAVAIDGATAAPSVGFYRTALGAAVTEALPARDATNPRIDVIVFRMLDPDVVGSHVYKWAQIEVVSGNPSATPLPPTSLPSMSEELCRINVPALGGGTASVDSSYRQYACAPGGRYVVPTSARLPAVASAPKYQYAVALDTGVEYRNTGTSWASLSSKRIETGDASLTFNSSGEATLTHNLGVVPIYLSATHLATTSVISIAPKSASLTSTTAVLVARVSGANYVGTISSVRWVAIS